VPKKAAPWYRRDRARWFATVSAKQIPLNVTDPTDREGAVAAFRALLESLAVKHNDDTLTPNDRATTPNESRFPVVGWLPTVADAVKAFLEKKKPKVSPGAFKQYRVALAVHFVPVFGTRALGTLTAEEIEEWAERPQWGNSTRNNYLGAVGTFLKWVNRPLPLKRPAKESRGADSVLSDEQFARVLAAYDARFGGADFRELLTVMRETGARPQEVARLTVEGVDWGNACTRLKEHKGRSKGLERVIYFPAAAVTILEAQRAKYDGTGYLFRTRAGKAYREKMIVQQMGRLSRRVGFRAIAYGLGRHSFATKALCSGVSDTIVASLLGHVDTAMIHHNYSHVGEQSRVLKAALEKVSGSKAG
jgi:integrase